MNLFFELSLVLVVATMVAFVMQRLRQSLLIGHILTGIIVGPLLLNVLRTREVLDIFSQLGITALLFLVGLNLRPSVLREVGKASVVVGLGQVALSVLLAFPLAQWLGFSWMASLYLAFAFSFSSTILVLKLLSDKRDLEKLHGKISVGVLLMQDVVALFVLAIISTLQAGGFQTIDHLTLAFTNACLLLAVAFIIARFFLPSMVRLFAASQEFLFLFAIAWGVGMASFSAILGFAPEIGGLLAGIALASSPYHYEINAKIKLLRDFFLVLFFVLLGSSLSFYGLSQFWREIVIFSAFVVIGKSIIIFLFMSALGYNKKTGFTVAVSLAQVSEFSLLLAILGVRLGHLSINVVSLLTVIALISMALSSYAVRFAGRLYGWFSPGLSLFEAQKPIREISRKERFEVILFGCHRVGEDFLSSIRKSRQKYLVVDFDPAVIAQLHRQGVPCRYGDAEDNEFLDELNLKQAKMIISTLPDFEANAFLLTKARKANPTVVAILIAHNVSEAMLLYRAGAAYVVMPHFLGGNYASLLVEKFGANAVKFSAERKRHLEHLRKKLPLARHAGSV
ncbi:MAG: cation:proton antiporter [Candidatus Uhrbacteria bacterium]|nr:cation:proton antiporter [Candidatus Uhrbacteria bacterium]